MGSVDQNSTFSEHGHLAYKIKVNHEFNNMVANILHADSALPQDPWVWGLNLTFPEQGHVVYQIKGINECNKMVTLFWLPDPPFIPPALGVGSICLI